MLGSACLGVDAPDAFDGCAFFASVPLVSGGCAAFGWRVYWSFGDESES